MDSFYFYFLNFFSTSFSNFLYPEESRFSYIEMNFFPDSLTLEKSSLEEAVFYTFSKAENFLHYKVAYSLVNFYNFFSTNYEEIRPYSIYGYSNT